MKTDAIITYLEQLALSPLEIKIYLALLKEGSLNAQTIIKNLRIHRTSVYPPLDSLFAKGLISKEIVDKQTQFSIIDPETSLRTLLDETLRRKQQELIKMETLFPTLIKQLPQPFQKTEATTEAETKFYKGKAGVKKIYEEVLQAKEQRSYVDSARIAEVFPENFQLFIDAFTHNPKIKMYEILDNYHHADDFLNQMSKKHNYFYKILPEGVKLTAHDIIIYENKIAIIYLTDTVSGVVLHNRDLYNNFKTLFDVMWKLLPEVKKHK